MRKGQSRRSRKSKPNLSPFYALCLARSVYWCHIAVVVGAGALVSWLSCTMCKLTNSIL